MAFLALLIMLAGGGPYRHFLPLWFGAPPPRVGVAVESLLPDTCSDVAQVGATWFYDWSPTPDECDTAEAVPMLYAPGDRPGPGETLTPGTYLLVHNECDLVGQCEAAPVAAAIDWHMVQETYPERRLIGPNTSQSGCQWRRDWYADYLFLYQEPPQIWALGVHCYGTLAHCQPLIEADIELAQQWTTSGMVWILEFAVPIGDVGGDRAAQAAESAKFLAWVSDNPSIERYAWYLARGGDDTALLDAGGLTVIGERFVDDR